MPGGRARGYGGAPRPTMTPPQPAAAMRAGTCSGRVTSPFPMTGILRTADTTSAILGQSAWPEKNCTVYRAWTVTAAMPTSSSDLASSGATTCSGSQPSLILAVTGTRPAE